jgi:MoaA/NifB/PqqE/SkfB family radical SAM enzyme
MIKTYKSTDYNYIFNTNTGLFMRWGNTLENDPEYSPIGPEILDIEVSEQCTKGCKMCYKSNVATGRNMSVETFKNIIDKMPTILQIAIGIGDIDGNPDLFAMMQYARSKNIVPNITINGTKLTETILDNLAKYCGAVAVSNYDRDTCYNAVKALTDRGMTQVNIHQLLSQETESQVFQLTLDYKRDSRLNKINAIVFLSLKQKGRGVTYHRLSNDRFKRIVDLCFINNIRFGFDSCTACKFTESIKDHPDFDRILPMIEPCESGLFSSYINVNGDFYPCSFSETGEGISVVNCVDFLKDVWYNPKVIEWRNNLIANKRSCPIYEV